MKRKTSSFEVFKSFACSSIFVAHHLFLGIVVLNNSEDKSKRKWTFYNIIESSVTVNINYFNRTFVRLLLLV